MVLAGNQQVKKTYSCLAVLRDLSIFGSVLRESILLSPDDATFSTVRVLYSRMHL